MYSKKVIVLFFAATLLVEVQPACQCPSGWIKGGTGGSCYKFLSEKKILNEHKEICEAENSHLVSIQTSEELFSLKQLMLDFTTGKNMGYTAFWTAGAVLNGKYIWEDGTSEPIFTGFLPDGGLSVNIINKVVIDPEGEFLYTRGPFMLYMAICELELPDTGMDIRVIDGPNENEGVAQMCINGTWTYICDTPPGIHTGCWPSEFCRNLNGPESIVLEVKYARHISGVSVDECIPLAYQVPECQSRTPADTVSREKSRRPGNPQCPQGYKQVVWVKCSETTDNDVQL